MVQKHKNQGWVCSSASRDLWKQRDVMLVLLGRSKTANDHKRNEKRRGIDAINEFLTEKKRV